MLNLKVKYAFIRCSDISVFLRLNLLCWRQREKTALKKKFVMDSVTVTGPVTKLKSHLTGLFRIGENTVARGSENT